MTAICLEGICKSFNKGAPTLSGLNLNVTPGERLAMVGPSGAGKTTLLRLIAGFEKPDSGRIIIGERDVTNLPPEARDIGFVFQNHALYPHLSVEENLGFPLRLRHVNRAHIAEQVSAMAELLNLHALLQRRPGELSGGEAQRVSLGRALIRKPAALLMDEPLSSLPPDLRLRLRHELIKIHEANRRPILYVTHDHEEALAIGERVAVLHNGQLQQMGSPREIYERPANRFVAGFVGKPAMNFIPADCAPKLNVSKAHTIGIRPEHLQPCEVAEAWFSGTINSIQYGGFHSDIFARCEAGELIARIFGPCPLKVGDPLPLRAQVHHVFDASGNRVEL